MGWDPFQPGGIGTTAAPVPGGLAKLLKKRVDLGHLNLQSPQSARVNIRKNMWKTQSFPRKMVFGVFFFHIDVNLPGAPPPKKTNMTSLTSKATIDVHSNQSGLIGYT